LPVANPPSATRLLGLELQVLHARNESEIETAFASLVQKRVGAVVVVSDAIFNSRPEQLAALAKRHAMPAVYSLREFARAGGLMSYGTSLAEAYRQAGVHTGRILKGEKPAELPVIQATKVELAINVKTAKTLGVTFPLSLLARAVKSRSHADSLGARWPAVRIILTNPDLRKVAGGRPASRSLPVAGWSSRSAASPGPAAPAWVRARA